MAEVHTGNDRYCPKLTLRLDNQAQHIWCHPARLLKAPYHQSAHALEAGLVHEGLQISVEGARVRRRVVFKEKDGVGKLRSILRSLQEIERAEVASKDRPLGNAF